MLVVPEAPHLVGSIWSGPVRVAGCDVDRGPVIDAPTDRRPTLVWQDVRAVHGV
ncbi:hypothetical protein ACSMXN_22045 [Jatrophihabitans sp. DSM 45814]